MRLKIVDTAGIPYRSCQLLQRTFDVAVRHLGVEHYDVVVELEVRRELDKDGSSGASDPHWRGNVAPVWIALQDVDTTVNTLAHELVHVADAATGRMSGCACDGGPRWEGRSYHEQETLAKLGDYAAYRSLPWERRAFAEAPVIAAKVEASIAAEATQAARRDAERAARFFYAGAQA
jgi:hypothetical protein